MQSVPIPLDTLTTYGFFVGKPDVLLSTQKEINLQNIMLSSEDDDLESSRNVDKILYSHTF